MPDAAEDAAEWRVPCLAQPRRGTGAGRQVGPMLAALQSLPLQDVPEILRAFPEVSKKARARAV